MSRLGTPYQKEVQITDNYTIDKSDDLIIATSIAGGKTATLPDPASCTGDDSEKSIVNLASSGGTLTLAGSVVGASSLLVGEAITVQSDGVGNWVAGSKFSAEGITVPATSTAQSTADSGGLAASSAKSGAVSAGLGASNATSAATSGSLNNSTTQSVATSQNASQSQNLSSTGSVAASAVLSGVSATASVATSQNASQSLNVSTALSAAIS